MKVYGCSREVIEQAAGAVDVKLYEVRDVSKRCIQFTIRPTDETPTEWRKVGYRGRKIAAINWSGHKAFFDALFDRCADCRVVTAVATYDGIDSYKRVMPTTHEYNVR